MYKYTFGGDIVVYSFLLYYVKWEKGRGRKKKGGNYNVDSKNVDYDNPD